MNIKKRTELLADGLRQLGTLAHVEITRKRKISTELLSIMDGLVDMKFPSGDTIEVCVQVKRTLRPSHLAEIEYLREQCRSQIPGAEFLLLSSAVSEPLAQELRNRKIWFVDMLGNAYVDLTRQLLLFVAGLKPAQTATRPPANRVSEQEARILFQLLRHGPEVRATYRDLVQATGVSLGMISKLFTRWRDEGLIRRAERGSHLVLQPAIALQLWCDAYAEQLAPKTLIGKYQSAHGEDFARLLQSPEVTVPAIIGGEYAADVLTGYLRAGGLHLYITEQDADSTRQQLRLAPSQHGSIELRHTFSSDLASEETRHGIPLAHPALIYAELMATPGDRLAETAMRLRQEHLAWTL